MSVTSKIASDGTVRWYLNDKLHRDGDLPAIEYWNGDNEWYQHGKRHRDGILPAIECTNGHKYWFRYGLLHRDGDLPATEHGSIKLWYQNDKRHRNGLLPAVEYADGSKEWWKYGEEYRIDNLIDCYSQLTDFGRLSLRKIKINRLKYVRWIHGELLCSPPRGNFPGGQDYHGMISYFNKL